VERLRLLRGRLVQYGEHFPPRLHDKEEHIKHYVKRGEEEEEGSG